MVLLISEYTFDSPLWVWWNIELISVNLTPKCILFLYSDVWTPSSPLFPFFPFSPLGLSFPPTALFRLFTLVSTLWFKVDIQRQCANPMKGVWGRWASGVWEKSLWNHWPSKISAALTGGTQVNCRAYRWSTLTICFLLPFAFVSKAKSPLRLEGSHEPIPERVTKLAGDDVCHSYGLLAAGLPRPHLSLWKALYQQARPG